MTINHIYAETKKLVTLWPEKSTTHGKDRDQTT